MIYFAYGSNLNIAQMAYRCPKAKPLEKAKLYGYRLTFQGVRKNSYGVANVVKASPENFVQGGLWDITEECLESLDIYEGFPNLYTRKKLWVARESSKTKVRAITYIMLPKYTHMAFPSLSYYSTIRQGYSDFGLNSGGLFCKVGI